MAKPHALLNHLRRALASAGDPTRAKAQQAYMKSAMPYHGVPIPGVRAICREVFATYTVEPERWRRDILAIWRGATHREERYAALELAHVKDARPLHTFGALPLFEELVVTGAWWDYVDTIASDDLGLVLRNDPKRMRRAMLAWSKSSDRWKRRSAILCQLRFAADTDLDLLYACIEPALGEKEFFLRKAIGWALRQYARTDPEEIIRYVEVNASRLSPLSRREALKRL